MKLAVDKDAGALHLRFDPYSIFKSEEIAPLMLECNESNDSYGSKCTDLPWRPSYPRSPST